MRLILEEISSLSNSLKGITYKRTTSQWELKWLSLSPSSTSVIQNQPGLAEIFSREPIVACRKEKSLKDILVRPKILATKPQSY